MKKKSLLVIGSGGREHALVYFLSRSPLVEKIYCAPGNGGIAQIAEPVTLNASDFSAVQDFIRQKNIDLTVIGPEAPLVEGLADALREKGHLVMGAGSKAALLEGSKIHAKIFMQKYGIPTADFRVFDDPEEAKKFAESQEGQKFRVLKADGLAAGKGVVVAQSAEEVGQAIREVMAQKKFGRAGDRIVLEELLEGPEVSLMALTDGKTLLPFPASQDHKRALDGDRGPNTGGMGAYAPTPFYDDPTRMRVKKDVMDNFMRGVEAEGLDYRGVIYFGLMLTEDGPKVLEFNVRFGDPETQVLLPLIESDLVHLFTAVAEGHLKKANLKIKPASACTVVLASEGYPASYGTGYPIKGLEGLDKKDRLIVFHAGTKKSDAGLVTAGGRVLNVTGIGKTLDAAIVRAYQGVKKISFKGMHFRNDIGSRVLKNKNITTRVKRMKVRHKKKTTMFAAL